MSAVSKAQSHDRIAGIEQGEKHCEIGVCSRMRLNVGVFRSEQFFCSFDGYVFDDVHIFAAAVISSSGVALGVFVGKHRAGCKQHRFRHYVFRRYKFDICALTIKFVVYRRVYFGVVLS